MAITVELENYEEWCYLYNIGKQFLDEPSEVLDALNELFDGATMTETDDRNPDNVYVNNYTKSTLIDYAIDFMDYNADTLENVDMDSLQEEIIEHCSDNYNFLAVVDSKIYFLQ